MDFKVYTNALKAFEAPNGDFIVSGTTSSTIRDLHGDEMTLNALHSMADTARQNMTIFLNHNYNVPEDLFGSVTDARVVKRFDAEAGAEVYDLDIDVLVCKEDENPEAMRAYKAIKRGVKLGLSIGARVDRVSKRKDSKTGEDSYVIDSVKLMEASVVGIPANQRSYLQNAVKSLRAAEKAGEIEIDTKAVEIEGQQGADKAPLVGALYTLLSETTAFYLKAHGAHWNVVGENFSQYHELFEEIYGDVHASLDPIAESLRKLNSPAPAEIKDLAGMVNSAPRAEDYEAESLAADLYAANEKLLENIMVAFKVASDANQQGIANFLAERQDMHQKWSWQLRASLAPEESEPEPVETPEAPEEGDTEGDTIVETEKATRVTVTVTQSDDKETKKPAEENQALEAAGAEAPADVAKSDTEPVAEPVAEPVVEVPAEEPATEEPAAEEPATEEPATEEAADPAVEVLEALGAVLVRASADERARIISKVAELALDGEPEAVAEAEEPTPEVTPEVVEEPAVAPVEPEAEVAVEASAVEEVTAIAKSALDAAFAAQQEVAAVKAQLTELLSQKATVEADLAKALDVVGRLMDLPSGRKSYSVAKNNSGTKAPWLSPVIQRMLDSEE